LTKKIRVARIIIYEGHPSWMRTQLDRSLQGIKVLHTQNGEARIWAKTIGEVPMEIPEDDALASEGDQD